MKKITYSIIIPAYSEEAFLGNTLTSLRAYLRTHGMFGETEVIVVTADSHDKTQAIAASFKKQFAHFIHIQPGPKVGKGRDVRAGLEVAHGAYILFMDADMATPLRHIRPAFSKLERYGGLVIAERDLNHMHKTLLRKLSSLLSNFFIKLLVGFDIHDSQCGFKGFSSEAHGIVLPRLSINGWSFDIEILKIAKIHNMHISKVHTPDWEDPKGSNQGLVGEHVVGAMLRSLRESLQIQYNSWRKIYD